MTETVKTDKQKESMLALKNANNHLSQVFSSVAKMDAAMTSVADDLKRVAAKLGDVELQVYHEAKFQTMSLKAYLNACSDRLNGART